MSTCEHCGKQHQNTNRYCPKTGKLIASRIFAEGELLEGKYRVNRTLGVGGMGAVFEATHTLLDKKVAVKVLLPGRMDEEGKMTARFVREARAASSTGHVNIASVTDMGWTDEGSLFVVMEYLGGETFVDLVDEGETLIPAYAVSLVMQALSGLEAVHRKGIIHRDLKPENLMLIVDDEGEEVVKILDFGISKITTSDEALNLTATGMVMGTPQYMSPEQARNSPDIDHRTDLYSMSAILYMLISGRPPIQEETISSQIVATVEGRIDPPSVHNPDIPLELDRIVMKALSRKPMDRFRDAKAFNKALKPHRELYQADTQESPSPLASNYDAAAELLKGLDKSSLVALDEVERRRRESVELETVRDKRESDEYGEFDIENAASDGAPGPQPGSLKEVGAARRERASARRNRRIDTGQQRVDETGHTMAADSGDLATEDTAPVEAEEEASINEEDVASALDNLSASDMMHIDHESPGSEAAAETTGRAEPEPEPEPEREPEPEPEEAEEPAEQGATTSLRPDKKGLEDNRFAPPQEDGWDGPLETEEVPDDPTAGVLTPTQTGETDMNVTGPPPPTVSTRPQRSAEPARSPRAPSKPSSPYGQAHADGGSTQKFVSLAVVLLVAIGGYFAYKKLQPGTADSVRISVYVIPQWAELRMEGQEVKVNPLVLPRARGQVKLEASAVGYRSKTVIVIPNKDQTIRIPLDPVPGAKPVGP